MWKQIRFVGQGRINRALPPRALYKTRWNALDSGVAIGRNDGGHGTHTLPSMEPATLYQRAEGAVHDFDNPQSAISDGTALVHRKNEVFRIRCNCFRRLRTMKHLVLFSYFFALLLHRSAGWIPRILYNQTKQERRYYLANPSTISQRAIDRKARYNIAIDERDVPVHQNTSTD
jgi:hypothetical protein